MKLKGKIKEITYAAMIVAIFVSVHLIFNANNRGVQSALGTISPVPIGFFCFSNNFKKNLPLCIASTLLCFAFFNTITVFSFVIPNIILGVVFGVMFRKEMKWWKLIILATLNVLFNVYEIYMNYVITGVDFIKFNIDSIKASTDILKQYYPALDEKIFLHLNISILPMVMIVGGVIKTFITYYITGVLLKRLQGAKFGVSEVAEHKKAFFAFEVGVIASLAVPAVLWTLFLLGVIEYCFVYSFLIAVAFVMVFIHYCVIHKELTQKYKNSKGKYLVLSFLFVCLFFVMSPITAIKDLVKASDAKKEKPDIKRKV